MKQSIVRFIGIIVFFCMVIIAVVPHAQAAQEPPIPPLTNRDGQPVGLTPRQGVELGQQQVYLLRLKEPPLASYTGGISGLAATSPRATGQRKLNASSPASLAYTDYLLARQDDFLRRLESQLGRPVEVRYRYYAANNGLALLLTPEEADQAKAFPEVIFIQPNFERQLDTDVSNAWIGSTGIWDGSTTGGLPATKGEGIIVGVIDTGINPSNPSFADIGGDGYNHTNPWGAGVYKGVCNPADPTYDATFPCNDKLIGAWGYPSVNSGNPRDYEGHGSHTASTAAGNATTAHLVGHTISVDRQISGVAPHANIVAYAACCTGDALSAAIDQIVLDGVDVVNYSIGSASPSDTWNDFDALGFLAARDAGIFVSASAGNNGPGAATVGGPGDAPWLNSSAAASHNRKTTNVLMNMSGGNTAPPANIVGVSFTAGYGPAQIVYAGNYGDPLCLNPFTAGTFSGQIVICDRGQNARVDKGNNVLQGGAGGFILANDASNGSSLTSDDHYLPAVHITYQDGVTLKAWVADGGASHSGTIRGTLFEINDAWGDILTDFSSRGPDRAVPDIIKPNITAPGEDVLAAAGIGDPNPAQWALYSGTSMASPHTAGSAALLIALHPTWTPAEIQSALMTTAWQDVSDYDYTQPDPFDFGSGRVDLTVAAKAGLVLNETKANYDAANPATGGNPSTLNLPSLGKGACYQTCSWTRTVRSTAAASVNWTVLPTSFNHMDLTVSPGSFTIAPGATQVITVTADVRRVPAEAWAFGEIRLLPNNPAIPPAHLPVAARASTSSNIDVLTKSANIDLVQQGSTIQYTVKLTHKSLSSATYNLTDPIPANASYVTGSATGGLTYNSGSNSLTWSGTIPAGTFAISEGTKTGYLSMGDLGAPPATKPSNLDAGCLGVTLNNLVYFGKTYTQGVWSVNGTLHVANYPFCTSNTNGQVPSTSNPNGILAPWWDDLDFTSGGAWYFVGVSWNGKPHTVFSWENVPVKGSSDLVSFQLWFEEGKDNVWFTYKPGSMPAGTPTATVGAENESGSVGATYYNNGTGKVPTGTVDLILGPLPVVQTFGFNVTANAAPSVLNEVSVTQGSTTHTAFDYTSVYLANNWVGNTNAWETPANWSRNVVPGGSDWVTVPTSPSGGQMPLLAANTGIFGLTIQPGARLDLGTFNLTAEESVANSGVLKQTRTAAVNTLTRYLNLTSASGSQTRYAGLDLTPTTGSMGATVVQVKGGAECTTGDPVDTVNRCFDIAPTTPQTANMRFYYLDSEKDGQLPASVLPWHWSTGSGWSSAGAVSARGDLQPDIHWLQADGVSAFSPFALSAKVSGPTAVTITNLSARSDLQVILPLLILAVAAAGLAAGIVYLVRRRKIA